jgi:hypothetical protein
VVGYLHPDSPQQMVRLLTAFHKGLGEAGYAEGPQCGVRISLGAQ